jgi:hypothetical protein
LGAATHCEELTRQLPKNRCQEKEEPGCIRTKFPFSATGKNNKPEIEKARRIS